MASPLIKAASAVARAVSPTRAAISTRFAAATIALVDTAIGRRTSGISSVSAELAGDRSVLRSLGFGSVEMLDGQAHHSCRTVRNLRREAQCAREFGRRAWRPR